LIWAAVRFGPLGANTALLIVTGLSIWGAVKGYGPFVGSNPAENVLALQLFLATISVPLMLLAALVQEGHERASYLSESEARFRSLADTAPVLIWMSGPDKLCTFLNKGWLDFTGRSLSQEVGDGWAENVHPDDLAECLAIYTTAFNARRDFAMEYRLRRHDGQYRWVWDRGLPRVGSDGAFLGYVGCADDITERKLAEQAVRDSENELMSLTGKLITAQESERARLARELHDDLSQSLSLLSVQLDLLGQQSTLNKDQVFPQLRDMSKRVKELSSVVHGLSHQLHPAKLQQLGLPMAIQGLCREVSSGHKLPIEFSQANVPENISGEAALCLYRIAQESLQNIVKHSGARKAALWLTGSGGSVCLQVIDDGVGFDAHKSGVTEGIGLVSIRERLRLVGGELAVVTRPEGGAHIEVRVPIAASAGADLTRPVSVAEAASV
jgi:PAS domain S-box-containing protein